MVKNTIDTLMEKSVLPSFSRLGILIRSRLFKWQPLDTYSLKGRVVVITGGTSGIGEAAAKRFAEQGATLVIVARDSDKADALVKSLQQSSGNQDIHTVIADLGKQENVREVAEQLTSSWPVIDILAHNAGALFNERKQAENGCDLSVELMVATPFLLTGLLLDNLKAAGKATGQAASSASDDQPSSSGAAAGAASGAASGAARVLTMSSGGMYTEALHVDNLQMKEDNYKGVTQYARAKRAQVVLNELWAEKLASDNIVFHALHPGWVNTPGITEALPGFSKVLSPLGLLRTADEGADTLVWLSVDEQASQSSGNFWHDRGVRDIDMTSKTRQADTADERQALWSWCEKHTGWEMV